RGAGGEDRFARQVGGRRERNRRDGPAQFLGQDTQPFIAETGASVLLRNCGADPAHGGDFLPQGRGIGFVAVQGAAYHLRPAPIRQEPPRLVAKLFEVVRKVEIHARFPTIPSQTVPGRRTLVKCSRTLPLAGRGCRADWLTSAPDVADPCADSPRRVGDGEASARNRLMVSIRGTLFHQMRCGPVDALVPADIACPSHGIVLRDRFPFYEMHSPQTGHPDKTGDSSSTVQPFTLEVPNEDHAAHAG